MAADLGIGGNCCADLEERVAELEATTARKGNRVVSLTVYGRVTQGILWHDDEDGYREGKATIRDDSGSPTLFGFRGEAQIRPDLTAGYVMEFGVSADNGTDGVTIRHSHAYLDSQTLGRVTIGQASQVTDALYEINLANTVLVPGNLNEESSFLNDALTDPWYYAFDGDRRQGVYYRSPTLAGFVLSAGYSHDSLEDAEKYSRGDVWEVALRYAGEFNGVRVAAGVGYRHEDYVDDGVFTTGGEADVFLGSASIMHMPTGLFVSGGLAKVEWEGGAADGAEQDGFWVMAGIEKNFFGPGTTTLFAEYGESNTNYDVTVTEEDPDGGDPVTTTFTVGDGRFWGFGIVQRIDAAATDLFLKYRHVEVDGSELVEDGANDSANVVIGGMRIQF
jgi:predicted porin